MSVTGQTAFTLWRTPSDPSPGLYSLKLSPSFNEFQLLHNETTPYWSTETSASKFKTTEWLEAGKLQRVVLVIMSKATGEVLESVSREKSDKDIMREIQAIMREEVVAGGGWQEVSILGGSDSADPDLGRRQLYYVTRRERQESFQELSPMKFLILSPKECSLSFHVFRNQDRNRSLNFELYDELNEVLTRSSRGWLLSVEVRVTPMRTEIIMRATITQNVLGEKRRSIRELPSFVKTVLSFMLRRDSDSFSKVHATLIDLVHKFVNETVGLNQYQALSAEMTNTDIELVNKKWEGRKNATLQLVYMEFSNLTVVFFRKLSTALRMPSVVLGCGRCGSEEETFSRAVPLPLLSVSERPGMYDVVESSWELICSYLILRLVAQDTGLARAAPLLRGHAKVESLRIAELNDFVITAPSQACQPE
ncbi:hypothetical protein Bca52824_002675 [Brassica carinata]|uniref:Uncharacterized protein n=1 Tax=Brassica carinata TaxID=52824 RepID=A0A8X8BE35_BRACI|nr:hypothetical protein Bca52824_002675 [Brassica carinata]